MQPSRNESESFVCAWLLSARRKDDSSVTEQRPVRSVGPTECDMGTLAQRISSGFLVGDSVGQEIDGIRRQAAQVRGLWKEFGWGGVDEPGPQTESSIERGYRLRGPVDDEWGRSESLDPDNVGDIADEGRGHRG